MHCYFTLCATNPEHDMSLFFEGWLDSCTKLSKVITGALMYCPPFSDNLHYGPNFHSPAVIWTFPLRSQGLNGRYMLLLQEKMLSHFEN